MQKHYRIGAESAHISETTEADGLSFSSHMQASTVRLCTRPYLLIALEVPLSIGTGEDLKMWRDWFSSLLLIEARIIKPGTNKI